MDLYCCYVTDLDVGLSVTHMKELVTAFKTDEPATGLVVELGFGSYATKPTLDILLLDGNDTRAEDYRGFNGFQRSASSSLVKSDLRNCSRTCGDFEHTSRNRHPPNLSQAVSFIGQYPAVA